MYPYWKEPIIEESICDWETTTAGNWSVDSYIFLKTLFNNLNIKNTDRSRQKSQPSGFDSIKIFQKHSLELISETFFLISQIAHFKTLKDIFLNKWLVNTVLHGAVDTTACHPQKKGLNR